MSEPMSVSARFLPLVLTAALLVACGDDRSSGAVDAGFDTAPDTADTRDDQEDLGGGEPDGGDRDATDTPDTTPDTEATLRDLCEESLDHFLKVDPSPEELERFCLIGALAGSDTNVQGAPTCEELFAQCVENPQLLQQLAADFREQVGGCPEELAECVVTRAQLDACVEEQEARLAQVELSCDSDIETLTAVYSEVGPACAELQGACDDEPEPGEGGYDYPACEEPFAGCGGDPTGTWTFDGVCLETDDEPFEALLALCPGSELTGTASAEGELILEPDGGRYSRNLTLIRSLEIRARGECADAICDAMLETFECNNSFRDSNLCMCTRRSSTGIGGQGWTQDGNTFRSSSQGPPTWAFCQDGDTMTIRPETGMDEFLVPRFGLSRTAQ